MSRFEKQKGSLSNTEFKELMKNFKFEKGTENALKKFLVDGVSYSNIEGYSRQFIYKKLVAIDRRHGFN